MRRIAAVAAALFATSAQALCFEQAAAEYGVSVHLLRGIAKAESDLDPKAVNRSHLARTGSVDLGLMQINSSWLPKLARYGITEQALLNDACLNLRVGAWILADAMNRHGADWNGVGAYNAACSQLKGAECAKARNTYAWRVYRAMHRTDASPVRPPVHASRLTLVSIPRTLPQQAAND